MVQHCGQTAGSQRQLGVQAATCSNMSRRRQPSCREIHSIPMYFDVFEVDTLSADEALAVEARLGSRSDDVASEYVVAAGRR